MRLVILVVVMMLLAGCAVSEGETCMDEECNDDDERGDGEGPGFPGGKPPIGAILGSIHLEECRGAGLGAEIPVDTVTDDVPPDFGPASTIPFMARLGVRAISCDRVVSFNETFTDVAVLWTWLGVVPKESDWAENGLSFYTFEVLVNDADFALHLAEAGVVTTFSVFGSDHTNVGGLKQEEWLFESENNSFRLVFPNDGKPSGAVMDRTYHFWTGDGPYGRIDVNVTDETSETFHITAATIEATGKSGFRDAAGVDLLAVDGATYDSIRWDIAGRPKPYPTEAVE